MTTFLLQYQESGEGKRLSSAVAGTMIKTGTREASDQDYQSRVRAALTGTSTKSREQQDQDKANSDFAAVPR